MRTMKARRRTLPFLEASASPSSGGKYSRTFPRYRVPLDDDQDEEDDGEFEEKIKEKGGWFPALFSASSGGGGGAYDASALRGVRRDLERRFEGQQLRWIELRPPSEKRQGQGAATGARALAALWRAAADARSGGPLVAVALPGADPRLVRRWKAMFDWWQQEQQQQQREESGAEGGDGAVQVEYWKESDLVPCVKLTPSVASAPSSSSAAEAASIASASSSRSSSAATVVNERTRSWVRRVLVKMRICPFTRSDKKSGQGLGDVGVPVADIDYRYSGASASDVETLMADAWDAVADMLDAGPGAVSSVLLAAPEFDGDFDTWAGPVFALLEAGVIAAGAEGDVGVVCFHPEYRTPDGTTFPGFGHMHSVPRLEKWVRETAEAEARAEKRRAMFASSGRGEVDDEGGDDLASGVGVGVPELTTEEIAAGGAWQRRTPHATINVLRAEQLQAAEGRRSTPELYARNVAKLVVDVGLDRLRDDLDRERGE